MRIALIADLAPGGQPGGGVQRATATLAAALNARDDVSVTVISPSTPGLPEDLPGSYPFDVARVPMTQRYQLFRGFRPWTRSVHEVLSGMGPDIVQGQAVLHTGSAAASWRGCPTVVAAHGDAVRDARWHYPRPLAILLEPMLRSSVTRTMSKADVVTNVTPDWRVNCPVEPPRHLYVPNAIEDVFYSQPTPPDDVRIVHYLGGLRSIKGLDILLAAWPSVRRRMPDAVLRAYGVDQGDLGDLANVGVESHPALDPEGVARALGQGGVLVVPSRFEVSPVAVVEAWAVGVPVVATTVGGLPALAEGAAHLVAPEDPDTLADGIVSALGREPWVGMVVAEGARRATTHKATEVAQAHVSIYTDLAGRR